MDVIPTRELLHAEPGGSYRRIARKVRDGELIRLRRGIVIPRTDLRPHEWLQLQIDAAATVINTGTWFSHRSAALLHGLPVHVRTGARVEVVRTMGGHGNTSQRVHARAAVLEPGDALWLNGRPVTSMERTVLDLVRAVRFPEAVMVADAGLRLGADRDSLLGRVQLGRGQRMAERALMFADPASESAGESESRALLAMAGVPAPELQVPLYDDSGRFLGRPDFLWRAQKVAGEYDGEGKYEGEYGITPAQAIRLEKARQAALEQEGYLVVRWDKQLLRTAGELERRVRRALASRRWPLVTD